MDLKEENYEEAISNLLKARKEAPSSSRAAYFLGIAYKQTQDFEKAASNLTDAVTLQPGVKEAALDLGEVYYHLGRNEESLKKLILAEELGVKPAHTSFLKGLVLMKLDRNDEAFDAFKKAKKLDPSMTQAANYHIGIVLVRQGKGLEAGEMFRETIVVDPNSDLAQFAKQYIDALTRKPEEVKPFKLSLGASYQYDDNVILKPSDQTVAGDISGEDDSRYVATLRGEYAPLSSGPFSVKTQYSVYYSDYQKLGSYDVMSHTFAIVPGYATAESMWNLLLSYNYTWVDDDGYMQTGTVSPSYTFMPMPDNLAQFSLRYQKKELIKAPFMADEDRDAQEYAASAGWFIFFAKNRGFVNLRYEYNKEETDGVNWTYTGNKGNLNIVMPLNDEFKLSASGEAYYQDFENINTNFLKKREDKTYTTSAMLSYEFRKNWEVQLQYAHIKANSNIAVYDYEKNVTSVGIEIKM
jgi:tetratricopeptide (TPR) repeat protein